MTVNEDIADAITGHRLYLLRFEGGAVKRLLSAYDDATGRVFEELDRLRRKARKTGLTAVDYERLRDLRLSLEVGIRVFQERAAFIVSESVEAAAEAERRIVAGHVTRSLPAEVAASFSLASQADRLVAMADFAAGRPWRVRLAVDLLEQQHRIQAILGEAQRVGLSMPRTARLLKQATTLQETYRHRYVAIARTEVQRVANVAALDTYKLNQDVIKGVQYLATLDSRTCLRCAPFHNRSFYYQNDGRLLAGDGTVAPTVPIHPRCRCFYTPITRSWEELGIGRTPSMTGKPAPETTFAQWLRRQSSDVQQEVFGSQKRWQAWRDGTVPLEGFATAQKVVTLAELRTRYADF